MVDSKAMSRHLVSMDKCEVMLRPDKGVSYSDYEAYLVSKIYYAGYVLGKNEAELSSADVLTLYKEGYKNGQSVARDNSEW